MRERTLDRLIRIGLTIVAIGVLLEAAAYVFDWRGEPSLLERQLSAAEDAVRDRPDDTGLRLRLAEIYRSADRAESALEQYQEVLDYEPGMSTALLGKGEVLAEMGDNHEAARSFRELIARSGGAEFSAVDPQLESAYYGLGSMLLEESRAKKAIAALRHAVQVEPTDADALYALGTAALQAGDPRLAVSALRQAVMFVPTGWCEPYEVLSKAYAATGRRPHARYADAMVDLCEERTEDAVHRLRRLTSGPAAVDAMLGLGMASELLSDRVGAQRWYRRVLAADEENFNARSGLNRLGAGPAAGSAAPPGHESFGGA